MSGPEIFVSSNGNLKVCIFLHITFRDLKIWYSRLDLGLYSKRIISYIFKFQILNFFEPDSKLGQFTYRATRTSLSKIQFASVQAKCLKSLSHIFIDETLLLFWIKCILQLWIRCTIINIFSYYHVRNYLSNVLFLFVKTRCVSFSLRFSKSEYDRWGDSINFCYRLVLRLKTFKFFHAACDKNLCIVV